MSSTSTNTPMSSPGPRRLGTRKGLSIVNIFLDTQSISRKNTVSLMYEGELCRKQYSNMVQLEQHRVGLEHNHKVRARDMETFQNAARMAEMAAAEERRRQKDAVMREVQPQKSVAPKKKGGFKNTFVATEELDPETEKKRKGLWKKVGEPTPPPENGERTTSDLPQSSPQTAATVSAANSTGKIQFRGWDSFSYAGIQYEDAYDPTHPTGYDQPSSDEET